jgi:hypothetical protein
MVMRLGLMDFVVLASGMAGSFFAVLVFLLCESTGIRR